MRSLLPFIAAVGLASLIAGSAAASELGRQARLHTRTGAITSLDRTQISVGGLTCDLPAPRAILSGNFALGEQVTIDCLGNILRLIRHHAEAISGTSASNGSGVTVTSGANGASSSAVTETSTGGSTNATSVASASSTDASGTTTSVSAEGPITALTSTSISIGVATCPFDRATYPSQSAVAQLQVGDVAKINCETYPDGTTTGSVTTP